MDKQKYLFKKKRASFTSRLFAKGLNAASVVLFSLADSGKSFLEELPSSYPGFALMKNMFGVSSKKKFTKQEIFVNLARLKKQGLVRKEPKKKIYYLTDEGKRFTAYIKDRYDILNEKWDGKLRIVIFDIPGSREYLRKWLLKELNLLSFQKLQRSVYIGKYPLPETFYEEISESGLHNSVFVFAVEEFDKTEHIVKILDG